MSGLYIDDSQVLPPPTHPSLPFYATVIIVFTNCSFVFRKQFWSPISIPDLISGDLMARLQLPPPMEPANSLAHHHWQLLLVLPAMTSAVDSTSIDWLKSVLSAAPSPLTTCMGAVELLSLSNDHKTKVIVKVLHTCIIVIVLLEYIYIMTLKYSNNAITTISL